VRSRVHPDIAPKHIIPPQSKGGWYRRKSHRRDIKVRGHSQSSATLLGYEPVGHIGESVCEVKRVRPLSKGTSFDLWSILEGLDGKESQFKLK
jgi:hypothetical protein